MATPTALSVPQLEMLFRAPATPLDNERMARHFDTAFQRTRDIHTALAAVNEHRVRPLDYESLLRHLGRA